MSWEIPIAHSHKSSLSVKVLTKSLRTHGVPCKVISRRLNRRHGAASLTKGLVLLTSSFERVWDRSLG